MRNLVGLILIFVVTTQAGEDEDGVVVRPEEKMEEEIHEEVFTVKVVPPTDGPDPPYTDLTAESNDIPTPSTSLPSTIATDKNTSPVTTTKSPTTTTTTKPTTTEKESTTETATSSSTTTSSTTESTTLPTTSTKIVEETTTTQPSTTTPTTTTESTTTTTTVPPTTTVPDISCPKDIYCEGKVLPADVPVSGRRVACDPKPAPKDHCCLPQGKHLVCYNITVDGYHLNFASERPAVSTDYMELCDALIQGQNAIAGAYSTISTALGGGELAYRYGEWAIVRPTRHRVKDIACMIVEPTPEPTPEVKTKKGEDKDKKENDTSNRQNK